MRLVLAVLLILTSPLALAIQVQGEGSSLEQAIKNAFKVAIDHQVGVILDTERSLRNGKIVHNQILSYSAGYITTYTIIHHIHIRDRNIHQVNVDVTVASSTLKNFLLSSNHNPKSFNIDDIKAQTQSIKKTYKDGMDLLDSTLKFFPNNAFNIETHDFSVIASQHNPNKHYLHIPYSITWNQAYLVALQELLMKFEVEGAISFVKFNEGKIYISDQKLMRRLKQTFSRNDQVLLNINSLHTDISINSCVQSIRDKPGEVHGSVKSLYTHPSRGIDIKSNNTVNSFILFPINENDLEEFEGTTEVTLSVSSVNNCPENS
jgi:hypothetical protein